MAIKSGETTYHQAKRGIVQNGLVLNLDAAVDASYDGGTTWRDLEGDNNGTLTNGPTQTKGNGGEINFDGTDDWAELPNMPIFNGCNAISAGIWINFSRLHGGGGANFPVMFVYIGNIFSIATSSFVAKDTYSVGSPATDICKLRGQVRAPSDGAWAIVDSGRIVAADSWTYLVVTYDGSDAMRTYINAVANSVQSTVPSTTNSSSLTAAINAYKPSSSVSLSYSGVGAIACAHVYNHTLTASEVLQNYNATRHRFGV